MKKKMLKFIGFGTTLVVSFQVIAQNAKEKEGKSDYLFKPSIKEMPRRLSFTYLH